jgi:hypothetical protein
MDPAKDDRAGQPAEKSSVGDDPALPPAHDIDHGIELIEIGDDVEQPGTDEGADKRPQ